MVNSVHQHSMLILWLLLRGHVRLDKQLSRGVARHRCVMQREVMGGARGSGWCRKPAPGSQHQAEDHQSNADGSNQQRSTISGRDIWRCTRVRLWEIGEAREILKACLWDTSASDAGGSVAAD